jgi:gluconolactonase
VAELTEITGGLEFPEGPVAMSDGSVIVTEIQGGRLTRVGPDGSKDVVAETGGGPNGAAIGPDGKLYVANNGGSFQYVDMGGLNFPHQPPPETWKGGRIERVDIETGEVDVLYEECDGNPLRGPNDLVFDAHGGFWFTDHGVRLERSSDRTGVYYARPDGSSIREAIFPMDAPNGVGLSPDGSRLYVAETFTNTVWWWPVTGPGEVEQVPGVFPHGGQLLYSPGGLQGFDSLGVDGEGHVCVATLVNGGISVVDGESGELVEFVPSPEDILPTNICFGGDDLRTAYITLSGTGRLASTEWPRPGLALAHGA